MKRTVLLLTLCLTLTACAPAAPQAVVSASTVSFTLPAEPKAAEVETRGTLLDLAGTCEGEGVTLADGVLTVTKSGTYTLTGSFQGQIVVDTPDEEKVVFFCNGVSVENGSGAAVLVVTCTKKVVFETAENSVNLFSAKGEEAAIESAEDLTFAGDGELYVTSDARGIHSKDDIEIESGSLYVTANEDAVAAKETLTMTGGTVAAVTGGGSKNAEPHQGEFGPGGQGGFDPGGQGGFDPGDRGGRDPGGRGGFDPGGRDPGGQGGFGGRTMAPEFPSAETEETVSRKGLKGGESLAVSGGTLDLDCADDTLHTNGVLTVTGGSLRLQSGDDGIHADDTLTITDGTIEILTSYEGLEADILRIDGGNIAITASDDGINAGITTQDMGFGGRGQSFASATNGLFLTGGTVTVNAGGDGIDSNSNVTMSGGAVTVYGPTNNGDGPLDYGGTFTFTGGTLAAVGSSGMAQSVTAQSGGVIFVKSRGSADSTLTVTDESGAELLALTPPKQYECLVFASGKLTKNETYTVSVGGKTFTATAE